MMRLLQQLVELRTKAGARALAGLCWDVNFLDFDIDTSIFSQWHLLNLRRGRLSSLAKSLTLKKREKDGRGISSGRNIPRRRSWRLRLWPNMTFLW
jgi:hypothetical protein